MHEKARGSEMKPLGLAETVYPEASPAPNPFTELHAHSALLGSSDHIWQAQKGYSVKMGPQHCTPSRGRLYFVIIYIVLNALPSVASGVPRTCLSLEKAPDIYTHGSSLVAEGYHLDKWGWVCLQDHPKQIDHTLERLDQHSRKYHHLRDKCVWLQISECLLWVLWFPHISHFWVIFFFIQWWLLHSSPQAAKAIWQH